MGKKKIKLRPIEKECWTAVSQAIQRLEMYIRFLPIQHQRAVALQTEADRGGIIPSLGVPPGFLKISGMRSMSPKEWIQHIESPLMEWEVYWESVYKSVYLINYISGFIPLTKAREYYQEHIALLGELEEARHTFAHFVDRLPSLENTAKQIGPFSYGYSNESYHFGESKWGTTVADMNEFLALCNQFVEIAETEFRTWSTTNMPQLPEQPQALAPHFNQIPQFHWVVQLAQDTI